MPRTSPGREIEKLARTLKRPRAVQSFLRSLPYNREIGGDTLRSADAALTHGSAHCLEAAFIAAAILEKNGYPPLVLSLESQDMLDHVVYIFRENGRWGSIARSRDEGLHGRPARFRSLRDLAWSYHDPFIDKTGRLVGYQSANLDETGADWRHSPKHVWKVEKFLLDIPHERLRSTNERYRRLHKLYLARGPMPSEKTWW